jgi:RNA polymerase sigma-70 factor (ECF subfamily)
MLAISIHYGMMSPEPISLPAAPATTTARNPGLAQLVERMAQGHQDALSKFFDETSPLVNGLLLRMLEHREDAEEVLLDVYMKAWKYASAYTEKRGSVQSWLVTMARSAAIDRIRQRRAQPKTQPFESETIPEPVSGESSPEEQSSGRERRHRMQQVLNELPAEQREALELAFFGGLTHAELSEHLGQPLGTVKSRIRMGLTRLRTLLEEPGL